MKTIFLVLAACLVLTCCTPETPQERAEREAQSLADCTPVMVAKSPDGVVLWRSYCAATEHRGVYFSSGGATYTDRYGKASIEMQVPNTGGIE